jgi:phospholipid N-methyltransferase
LIDRFTLHRKNIFELACGTGVVAKELLKLGYNVK